MPQATKVIIIFTLLCSAFGTAQNEKVVIHEKKTGKRVTLLAENKTSDTLNIFLMIQAEGYRRSAEKPVLTNLPPFSTVAITTLIELANADSAYTYDLIVNEQENLVQIDYEKEVIDISSILKNKLVLFRPTRCGKCDILEAMLDKSRLEFRTFNIEKSPSIERQLHAFLDTTIKDQSNIRYPVIWNKDHVQLGYDDLELTLQNLIGK
jgi:glutaredoxin